MRQTVPHVFFSFACAAEPSVGLWGRILSAARCFRVEVQDITERGYGSEAQFEAHLERKASIQGSGPVRLCLFALTSSRPDCRFLKGLFAPTGENPHRFPLFGFHMNLDPERNLWIIEPRNRIYTSGRGGPRVGVEELHANLTGIVSASILEADPFLAKEKSEGPPFSCETSTSCSKAERSVGHE